MSSLYGGRGPTGSMQGLRGGSPGDVIPSGYRKYQLQQFDPSQMELYNRLYGQVSSDSDLSKLAGGDQSYFDEIEAPALQQFSALQGNIASRFSGNGLGGRKSSGFQNTMTSAASNFAQQLQSNRQNLQRQAIQDLSGLSNQLLGYRPQQSGIYEKRQKESGLGGWGALGGAALGGLGGFALGGPAGAFGGAQLGYNVGSQF